MAKNPEWKQQAKTRRHQRRSRTPQGRRVASKTFTILGASTPEIRISTTLGLRKQKGRPSCRQKQDPPFRVSFRQRFVAALAAYRSRLPPLIEGRTCNTPALRGLIPAAQQIVKEHRTWDN
jgi:hypothetical protein